MTLKCIIINHSTKSPIRGPGEWLARLFSVVLEIL
jgi:hypothetical protein